MARRDRGRRDRSEWTDLFRGLGNAVGDLFGAEIESLRRELARTGKGAAVGVALVAVAVFLLFWALGTTVFAAIAFVAQWLPVWGAALAVTGGIGLVIAALVGTAVWRFKTLEFPWETVRRRWQDHVEFWRSLLSEPVEDPKDEDERGRNDGEDDDTGG